MSAMLTPHFFNHVWRLKPYELVRKISLESRMTKERLDVVNNGIVSGFHLLFVLIPSTK